MAAAPFTMTTNRVEAFCKGMLVIVITILVLEIKASQDSDPQALLPQIPILLSYVLSLIYIGINWNNHHHLLPTQKRVVGSILWANLYLLFSLSLIPFATGWMGQNHFAPAPTAFYGVILRGH
jgi:uncharacterized membrane protein